MKDTKLYETLLGLAPPWQVQSVDLQLDIGQILIKVDAGSQLWGCPECEKRMHVHDYTTRQWRHLDTFQFKTFIEARVPRVKCCEHGTMTVRVPWAEKHGRFTALFERLAIDLMRDCSIKAASKYLRLSWDKADNIKKRAVERGLRRKKTIKSNAICIDEKSVGYGHDYVTVVTKVTDAGPVVDYIGDDRDESSLDGFWKSHNSEELQEIHCVSMDMWKPYINSVVANLPEGEKAISHDPFHIVKNMNAAVDAVRRKEMALLSYEETKELKGTRYMWLYGEENLPDKWFDRIRSLKQSHMKTARAWRLKETLRAMYQCVTWDQAVTFFKEWYRDAMRSKLEPVKKVARGLKEHLHAVLNYFIFHITNAYSEGINSTIQALIKRANGYRNRERLKRDLFFHLGGLSLYPNLRQ